MTAKTTLRTGHSKGGSSMKKKLLLIALPALMALSGCANIQKEQPKVEEQPAIELEEDTVAHEEIFGEAVEAKQPAIKKMDVVDTQSAYKVGYQIHFDDKGTTSGDGYEDDDTISIRFIAAINDEYSSMVWSRGVATKNGVETKAFGDKRSDGTTPLASTVVYSSLCNGAGNDVMEANQGAYVGYTGFIVYSIRNIPYKANKDSYIGVSLLMDAVQTDFYAIKIGTNAGHTASANTFKVANGKSGFLLAGTIAGSAKTIDADAKTKEQWDGQNAASFTLDLEADDNFVVIQKESDHFKLWDASCLGDEGYGFAKTNGLITVSTETRYVVYLNKENGVFHEQYRLEKTPYYVRGTAAGGWDVTEESSYRFFTDSDNKGILLEVLLTGGEGKAFKIGGLSWDTYNLGADRLTGGAKTLGYVSGTSGDISCNRTAYYNLYLTNDDWISVEWVRDA